VHRCPASPVRQGEKDAQIAVAAAESLGKRVLQMALVLKVGGEACRELLANDDSWQPLLDRLGGKKE
jgi:hypothetical protein